MDLSNNIIVILNIDKICRICLVENENNKSVYTNLNETQILENDISNLSDVLTKITSIPVSTDDGFPPNICSNCWNRAYEAYKFKVQFDHSHTILQQCISTSTKVSVDLNTVVPGNTNSVDNEAYLPEVIQPQEKRIDYASMLKLYADKNQVRNSTKPTLHPCSVCTREFTPANLRRHIQTHKTFKKYLNIPQHLRVSRKARFYKEVESDNSATSSHFHLNLHNCISCNAQLKAVELPKHMQAHLNSNEHKCNQCQRVFKKLNHLNMHRIQHLKEHPYECKECGKGFVMKLNYDCHLLTHNTNQELPEQCKQCLQRFSNPSHLRRHMLIHKENVTYSNKYKVLRCYSCSKTFKDQTQLKSHQCQPNGVQYKCKECNKSYKSAMALYTHMRQKKFGGSYKKQSMQGLCFVCGKYVTNIYVHMQQHKKHKPHACDQCDKRFLRKHELRNHLLVHSGVKRFICSKCGKAFSFVHNLQAHERTHDGNRCHLCIVCNKKFLERSYLKRHMKVHQASSH